MSLQYAQQQVMEQQLQELEQPSSSSSGPVIPTPAAGGGEGVTPTMQEGYTPEASAMATSPMDTGRTPAATAGGSSGGKRGGRRHRPKQPPQQQQQAASPSTDQWMDTTPLPLGKVHTAATPAAGMPTAAAKGDVGGASSSRSSGGYGLAGAADVMACRAAWYLHLGKYQEAYRITQELLTQDPDALECLETHVVAALQLGKKNELFLR